MPVKEDALSWRLNAESIQLYHPPLHLTFQGTHISSLRCQTFSTCYFALVPQAMSIPLAFQEDGLGEVGHQRLMLKWGWGWGSGQWTAIHFWSCWLHVSACDDTLSKRMDVSNSVHWFVVNSLLHVNTSTVLERLQKRKICQTCVHWFLFSACKTRRCFIC